MTAIKINIGGVNIEMDKDEALKAIEAGELAVKNDELLIYKKEEFETFKTNLANDEYKKGKAAGEEMPFKFEVLKEKYGVEVTGKNLDSFAEALKKKTLEEAKIEPSKKIQELQSDNEKLLSNYRTIESDFAAFKTNIAEREVRSSKDAKLLSFMPKTGLKIDADIALLALKQKAGVDADFNEQGDAVPMKNGQIIKDTKTLQPVSFEAFITENLTALGLIESAGGGRGAGDDAGKGGATNQYDAFVKQMEANGISEGSQEFSKEMNLRISAGTLKV